MTDANAYGSKQCEPGAEPTTLRAVLQWHQTALQLTALQLTALQLIALHVCYNLLIVLASVQMHC